MTIKMGRSRLRTRLRKIGTGQGFLISKAICGLLAIEIGDELLLEIEGEDLVLKIVPKER